MIEQIMFQHWYPLINHSKSSIEFLRKPPLATCVLDGYVLLWRFMFAQTQISHYTVPNIPGWKAYQLLPTRPNSRSTPEKDAEQAIKIWPHLPICLHPCQQYTIKQKYFHTIKKAFSRISPHHADDGRPRREWISHGKPWWSGFRFAWLGAIRSVRRNCCCCCCFCCFDSHNKECDGNGKKDKMSHSVHIRPAFWWKLPTDRTNGPQSGGWQRVSWKKFPWLRSAPDWNNFRKIFIIIHY